MTITSLRLTQVILSKRFFFGHSIRVIFGDLCYSFKKTKGMVSLLEERSKRQKDLQRPTSDGAQDRKPATGDDGRSLHSLAERVKRKSAAARGSGMGKRRKL